MRWQYIDEMFLSKVLTLVTDAQKRPLRGAFEKLLFGNFVYNGQGIERSRETDVRHRNHDGINQILTGVTDT